MQKKHFIFLKILHILCIWIKILKVTLHQVCHDFFPTHQVVIENLRYGITDETDRRILRRILVDFSSVKRASKRRRFVVYIGEDDGDFGTDRQGWIDLRHFFHRNFQNESAVAILISFSVQLCSGEYEAGCCIDIEQIPWPLGDAVRHLVVYPLITVHSANCNLPSDRRNQCILYTYFC